jgi:hypothetical protein
VLSNKLLQPTSGSASANLFAASGTPLAAERQALGLQDVVVSFDVFLQRFANGERAEVDRLPVREVLRAATYRGPDDFGFYVVAFPDGVEVEFSARGLESEKSFTECAFHIHGIGDGLMKFVFDVARAGDMVIIPAMEGNPLVMVSESQGASVPVDVSASLQPILVRSPGELGAVLTSGVEGWSTYRAHILGRSRADGERTG